MLTGDGVLGEHPLVCLKLSQEDVAVDLVGGLLAVGKEPRHQQAGVRQVALERALVRRRGQANGGVADPVARAAYAGVGKPEEGVGVMPCA